MPQHPAIHRQTYVVTRTSTYCTVPGQLYYVWKKKRLCKNLTVSSTQASKNDRKEEKSKSLLSLGLQIVQLGSEAAANCQNTDQALMLSTGECRFFPPPFETKQRVRLCEDSGIFPTPRKACTVDKIFSESKKMSIQENVQFQRAHSRHLICTMRKKRENSIRAAGLAQLTSVVSRRPVPFRRQ